MNPEFKPGDFVVFRTTMVGPPVARPRVFQVVESIVQTCPGGTQVLYKLGEVESLHNEITLTRWDGDECQEYLKEVEATDPLKRWSAATDALQRARDTK